MECLDAGETRREALRTLALMAIAGATSASACAPLDAPELPVWTGAPRAEVIDAHCHLFNGSDLPVVRFLKYVGLHKYPEEAVGALDVEDPDLLDGLLALLSAILGIGLAPSAAKESRVLARRAIAEPASGETGANAQAVISAVATYIDPSAPMAASAEGAPRSRVLIRAAILQAAFPDAIAAAEAPLTPMGARHAAEKAYASDHPIGRYLRWFGLFTRYRHVLTDRLAEDHARQGFVVRFMAPATVDYDHWLGELVDKSPLPQQVEVMGRIAARRNGPPVHAYVAYDPLRRAIFRPLEQDVAFAALLGAPGSRDLIRRRMFSTPQLRKLRDDPRFRAARFDPLDLVDQALREHGLVGVKIYPPMGFKPWNNLEKPQQSYPKTVDDALGGVVGAALNRSLTELYTLCLRLDAPILAHAGASVGANRGYERRADPAYWAELLSDPRWRGLRVCLAHFGGFNVNSATTPNLPMPEGSWEWAFGRLVKGTPSLRAFMDVSYMTEVALAGSEARQRLAVNVKAYLAAFDPECRHMVFGTDWVMVGREAAYPRFTGAMYDFFAQDCSLEPHALRRLFIDNAVVFLGLKPGDSTRERILNFYDSRGVPRDKLAI